MGEGSKGLVQQMSSLGGRGCRRGRGRGRGGRARVRHSWLDDQEINNAEDDGKHNQGHKSNQTNEQWLVGLPKQI